MLPQRTPPPFNPLNILKLFSYRKYHLHEKFTAIIFLNRQSLAVLRAIKLKQGHKFAFTRKLILISSYDFNKIPHNIQYWNVEITYSVL